METSHGGQPTLLDEVIITEAFATRPARIPNFERENAALRRLAEVFLGSPECLLKELVESSLELCGADAAGISVETTEPDGEQVFRLIAIAGTLKSELGRSVPRNFSPFGICVDSGVPQVFANPEQYYTYLLGTQLPFVEALLVPWKLGNGPSVIIWIVSHGEQNFDPEDLRVMSTLAEFTAMSLRHASDEDALQKNAEIAAAAKLAAKLADQINNPLQAVQSALALIEQEQGLTEKGRRLVAIAEAGTTQAGLIAKEILNSNAAEIHTVASAAITIEQEDLIKNANEC